MSRVVRVRHGGPADDQRWYEDQGMRFLNRPESEWRIVNERPVMPSARNTLTAARRAALHRAAQTVLDRSGKLLCDGWPCRLDSSQAIYLNRSQLTGDADQK